MRHSNTSIQDSPSAPDQSSGSQAVSLARPGSPPCPRPASLSKHQNTAGVTLVEVLIVVAIMAMLTSAIGVVVLPKFKEAQVNTAKTSAQVLRRAVQDWQRINNEVTCPTMTQLVDGKHVDAASNTDDPWGLQWTMICTEDEIFVQSAGPDKKLGTEDDISVPKLRADMER